MSYPGRIKWGCHWYRLGKPQPVDAPYAPPLRFHLGVELWHGPNHSWHFRGYLIWWAFSVTAYR